MKRVHEGRHGERLEHAAASPASRRRELHVPPTAISPILAALALAATMLAATLAVSAAPLSAQLRTMYDVRVPMRDGVELSTDVWLPDADGRFPAILIRSPYLKATMFGRYGMEYFVRHGYAVVLQDTRGRGDSDGEFHFYFGEGEDGYDTIEWIAQQPWSNGDVGTSGGSYLGTVQWLAARERPPHLRCMIPTASSGRLFDELPYLGGAFRLGWAIDWLNDTSARSSQRAGAAALDWEAILAHRPLSTLDDFMGRRIPLWKEFLQHDTLDEYWAPLHFEAWDFQQIDIPVLTVTGWFDGDQLGALSYWDGMARHNPGTEHYLVMGPWLHAETYLGGELSVRDLELSPASVLPIQEIRRQFFDYCLKGSSPSFDAPKARVYLSSTGRWLELDEYPPPQATPTQLYLHSNGAANSLLGDGRLTWDAPRTAEPPDRFVYDPHNPVPTVGRAVDQRPVQRRDDVLVYTTEPLADTVVVMGRVFVRLHAASDALDTDFTAKIEDVYPDGRAILLGPTEAGSVRRARYRAGYLGTELLTPDEPELFEIELFAIGHAFLPGHRIRIEISSSAFPMVNPNQNTGNPVATDTEWKTANQTVFHDPERPSHVLLPVLRRE